LKFWFHLARTVTHTSVKETQETITAAEFTQWMALYGLDPWGDDWAQAATITTAALSPWTKKRLDPRQFIPGRKAVRSQTREEVAHRLGLFFDQYEKNRSGD